MNLFRQNI